MFKRMKEVRELKYLKLQYETALLMKLFNLTKLFSLDNQDIVDLASKVKDMDISAIVQEVLKNQELDIK